MKVINHRNSTQILGHSFRRTSITAYANSGASIEALKRHSNHKSTKICESYIGESIGNKKRVGQVMAFSLNRPSTSTANPFDGASSTVVSFVPSVAADFTSVSVSDSIEHPLPNAYIGNDNRAKLDHGDVTVASSRSFDGTSSSIHSYIDDGNRAKLEHGNVTVASRRSSSIHSFLPSVAADFTNDSVVDSIELPLADLNGGNDHRTVHGNVDGANSSTGVDCAVDSFLSSQVNTQNCVAQLDKRFVFHKCRKITINFHQK